MHVGFGVFGLMKAQLCHTPKKKKKKKKIPKSKALIEITFNTSELCPQLVEHKKQSKISHVL
jgi:hypothetical protein